MKGSTTRITIEVSQEDAESIRELCRRTKGNEWGGLTPKTLCQMLMEDAAMVISRPGSWEGSNMRDVLRSHGY